MYCNSEMLIFFFFIYTKIHQKSTIGIINFYIRTIRKKSQTVIIIIRCEKRKTYLKNYFNSIIHARSKDKSGVVYFIFLVNTFSVSKNYPNCSNRTLKYMNFSHDGTLFEINC